MNTFEEHSNLFYGDGTHEINEPLQLLHAVALYKQFYGRDKLLEGSVPEYQYDILDLDGKNKDIGGVKWSPCVREVYRTNADQHVQFVVKGAGKTVDDEYVISSYCPNIQVGDYIQFVDGIHKTPNLRYEGKMVVPVQARVTQIAKDEQNPLGMLYFRLKYPAARGFIIDTDTFVVVPSRISGGIKAADNSDSMLIIFPLNVGE